MGLFGLFEKKDKSNRAKKRAMKEFVEQKKREEALRNEEEIKRWKEERSILKEHEMPPFLAVPDYDLSAGFPFSNKEYVCFVSMAINRKNGEVVEQSRAYYADSEAIEKAKHDVIALEKMLSPEKLGIASLPTLVTNFRMVKPVAGNDERVQWIPWISQLSEGWINWQGPIPFLERPHLLWCAFQDHKW